MSHTGFAVVVIMTMGAVPVHARDSAWAVKDWECRSQAVPAAMAITIAPVGKEASFSTKFQGSVRSGRSVVTLLEAKPLAVSVTDDFGRPIVKQAEGVHVVTRDRNAMTIGEFWLFRVNGTVYYAGLASPRVDDTFLKMGVVCE